MLSYSHKRTTLLRKLSKAQEGYAWLHNQSECITEGENTHSIRGLKGHHSSQKA